MRTVWVFLQWWGDQKMVLSNTLERGYGGKCQGLWNAGKEVYQGLWAWRCLIRLY